MLAFWYANSCRIVCVIAVRAYFDAGYTLNNGMGSSGMRWPSTLKKYEKWLQSFGLEKVWLKSVESSIQFDGLFSWYPLNRSKMIYSEWSVKYFVELEIYVVIKLIVLNWFFTGKTDERQ